MIKKESLRGRAAVLTLTAFALAATSPAFAEEDQGLSVSAIEAAQQQWGEGIVRIGAEMRNGGDPEAAARHHIETLYAYDSSAVLFKPTKAADDQFRGSFNEALSYFVGGAIAEDSGFALQPWTHVRFENEGIVLNGDSATAMGNYYFRSLDGEEVKVEYTFGYIENDDGTPRIYLHHSSLPFNAES